ncbi:DUF6194 family protein [uncultured Nocardioides sp.]|uniref:DUF6194 family protein n=1 Tax=uncultured Nocardioides sp. TaxID=198441 RepID=UPI00260D971D|nr:DUF6194 family protein [uncultured Nocardioides sp.]
MSLERLLETVRALDGVLELAPTEGGPFPEIAWGDHFFYYAPDGEVPTREQPHTTVVTKDYPDDTLCDLDPPGRWRLNVHVGAATFTALTGEDPGDEPGAWDWTATDVVLPHPVYRAQGWVSIVCPSPDGPAADLVRRAHDDARRRAERREG